MSHLQSTFVQVQKTNPKLFHAAHWDHSTYEITAKYETWVKYSFNLLLLTISLSLFTAFLLLSEFTSQVFISITLILSLILSRIDLGKQAESLSHAAGDQEERGTVSPPSGFRAEPWEGLWRGERELRFLINIYTLYFCLYFYHRLYFCDFLSKYSVAITLASVLLIYWELNSVATKRMRRGSLRCSLRFNLTSFNLPSCCTGR